jgi:hypothetical protein
MASTRAGDHTAPMAKTSPAVPALKAAYTIKELVDMTGLSRTTVRALIVRNNVPRLDGRRGALIPLVHLQTIFPDLWESIRLVWQYSAAIEG